MEYSQIMEILRATKSDLYIAINSVWVLLTAALVFFMQAGFAILEAGLTRAKNTANLLMKNFMDFTLASIAFFLVGYAFMFGDGSTIIGTRGFFLVNAKNPAEGTVPLLVFWIFQLVFAGTAATIVAGAVAERMKFSAYLMYSFLITAIIYPTVGHWIWGGGWLQELGFIDFAGSTVVHSVGAWAGLIGAIVLGPRIGKYASDGTPKIIRGHNLSLVILGTFILWFGWYGFNPGSALSVGDGKLIALIAVNTTLAAASGALLAMFTTWMKTGKPELTMTANGALAGLVAITAGCAYMEPGFAILIGMVAGVIVVFAVILLDQIFKVDDPVGAVAVHGFNGAWGTLAVGLFGKKELGVPYGSLVYGYGLKQVGIQLIGIIVTFLFVIGTMYVIFKFIDALVGLRVSREEELMGLDIPEHGNEAYAGFQIFTTE